METSLTLKTAILGFGNLVRSEDAVGIYVINELQKHFQHHENITIFDMGTSAFEILFKLGGHQRIIIVDGVFNSGEPDGVLAVTDTQNYRILVWRHWKDSFASPADAIIGQPDLESNGQNQYHLAAQANMLSWCYDVFMKNGSLWLADTGNSRILFFKNIPTQNNQSADQLFGNINFETPGEHLETRKQNSGRLYWPFGISVMGDQLIVAMLATTG